MAKSRKKARKPAKRTAKKRKPAVKAKARKPAKKTRRAKRRKQVSIVDTVDRRGARNRRIAQPPRRTQHVRRLKFSGRAPRCARPLTRGGVSCI